MFALMLAGIAASPFGMMNAKASNWTDTKYSLRYNGDGGDVSTGKRQKQDDSYVISNIWEMWEHGFLSELWDTQEIIQE